MPCELCQDRGYWLEIDIHGQTVPSRAVICPNGCVRFVDFGTAYSDPDMDECYRPEPPAIRPHRQGEDRFDFPCSRTFRDFFSDPYGPVYREPDENIDDRIRRAVRDELAIRDAAAENRQRHDRVLFGPDPTPVQEEPPEMPPVDELTRPPAQKTQPKAEMKPQYRGLDIE